MEPKLDSEFKRELGLFDATMVVAGAMIGSGIFLVSAEMSRLIGSPGWLLAAWAMTGVLTIAAALSYGELAALMPRAGGQYVFLRESLSPLWGYLFAWTFILVIQAGAIAAVAVAFSRFAGVIVPGIAEDHYLIQPQRLTTAPTSWLSHYALSLSSAQVVAIALIVLLTAMNMRGVRYGKIVQNIFTVAKVGALLALIALGLTFGLKNGGAVKENLAAFWHAQPTESLSGGLTAASTFGLFVALCLAQTGSMFSADSWHNVTIIAGEVREPRRNLPLALALGAGGVITLYLLANVAYLAVLPLDGIQHAQNDRVATAMLQQVFPGIGVALMAVAIIVSTFGCNNGLILAGARSSYTLARDGLFFRRVGTLNAAKVPAWGLALQCVWAACLTLPRTYDPATGKYGNLYSNLLDYVISAALLFYVLTLIGLFRLRFTRPDAERPYRAFGYPVVPALYVIGATAIFVALLVYRTTTTWPGLAIVVLGVPVYYLWKLRGPAPGASETPPTTDSGPNPPARPGSQG